MKRMKNNFRANFPKRVITLLIPLFLVGCSTTQQQAATKLCSGTQRPYQIKGTWHYPQDHYDYEERGVASWYGPGFHGKPKSCGGKYNMHGISAAHKTLPIPSVVQVTNTNTGDSLRLVVDDRGPFIGNRIIDLSKGAAMKLGTHARGLGEVHVQALPEDSKALAAYLLRYGRYGHDPSGRDWLTIYQEEIEGKTEHPVPAAKAAVYTPHSRQKPINTKQRRARKPAFQPSRKQSTLGKIDAKRDVSKSSDQNLEQLIQKSQKPRPKKHRPSAKAI